MAQGFVILEAMRLPALQSNTYFTLLELDRIAQLAADLGLKIDEMGNKQLLTRVLRTLQSELSPSVSGLIIEPEFGLPLVLGLSKHSPKQSAKQPGLLLSLDALSSTTIDPLPLPQLIQNWGVVAVRNNYGVAKVTLYYHPDEAAALKKKQLIAELYDHCHHEGIDMALKLIIYTQADEEFSVEAFQDTQLTAVSEFRRSCDLLALQYPQDALACATLTTELDIPWVVVGDGHQYDLFKEIVRDSLEGGAQGFWAGEAFWHELQGLRQRDMSPDLPAIEQYIKTTVRDRVIELTRIVAEFTVE